MPEQFKISENIMNTILKNVIPLADGPNADHIHNIITRELPNHAKESILHLSLMESAYDPVELNGYVKVIAPKYHVSEYFEWDILQDMGLNPGDGYVYAKVIGDTSWGSDPFNPFYSSIKLELLYHDEEKKLQVKEYQASPLDLIKVEMDSIKYFDILATDSEPIHHTADVIFPNDESNTKDDA